MNRQEASDLVTSLFESWYAALVRYACRLTGSSALAQDIVQQTFMDLYTALVEGQRITYPKAWTITVVRRQVAASWGKLAGTEPLSVLEREKIAAVQPDTCDEDIPKLLSLLTPREQEVLMLRMEAYKYREIAQCLGISSNSVNTLLARAIAKLQKVMKPAGVAAPWSADPEAAHRKSCGISPEEPEPLSHAAKR
jgi:RNA polymerase sigma-70 factor, ECF subfamily